MAIRIVPGTGTEHHHSFLSISCLRLLPFLTWSYSPSTLVITVTASVNSSSVIHSFILQFLVLVPSAKDFYNTDTFHYFSPTYILHQNSTTHTIPLHISQVLHWYNS
jgi:hypothetical protein